MKKLYNKYFYIPRHGKVPEKAMLARVAVSVAFIVFCLAVMSFSAFAYFSHNVSSAKTEIKSATYELNVTSTEVEGSDGYYLIENTSDNDAVYTFTVSCAEGTTASVGFCKIVAVTDQTVENDITLENGSVIQNAQVFYTKPIWNKTYETEAKPSSREITLTLKSGKSVQLWFVSEWGSTANTTIDDVVEPLFKTEESGGQQSGSDQPNGESAVQGEPSAEQTEETEASEKTEDSEETDVTEEASLGDGEQSTNENTPETDITE